MATLSLPAMSSSENTRPASSGTCMVAKYCGVTHDSDISVVVFAGQVRIIGTRHAAHPRQGGQRFQNSLVQSIHLVGLIAGEPGIHVESDQVVRGKSQIHRLKITKSANEQPCANE